MVAFPEKHTGNSCCQSSGYRISSQCHSSLSFLLCALNNKAIFNHARIVSVSGIERSACNKMLRFTIWSVFFANVLTVSVLGQLEVFLDPKEMPSRRAIIVPAQVSFFVAYVVTSWTSITSELTQTAALLFHLWGYCAKCCKRDDSKPPSKPYHSEIPRILLFGLLGLTYIIVAPLILPFMLVYFCLGYFIFRNQYDTGGRFWPIVHNATMFSLVLMHIIAIGVFGLKKLPLASNLLVPLPVLTLLFNEYCRNRFYPIFKAFYRAATSMACDVSSFSLFVPVVFDKEREKNRANQRWQNSSAIL